VYSAYSAVSPTNSFPPTLLVQGAADAVFPVEQAKRVAECLRTNGVAVDLQVLPGTSHDFGPSRLQVLRAAGEYCLAHLTGPDALARYLSAAAWKLNSSPLWLFLLPGALLVIGGASRAPRFTLHAPRFTLHAPRSTLHAPRSTLRAPRSTLHAPRSTLRAPRSTLYVPVLYLLTSVSFLAALALTSLHLVTPRLPVGPRTLAIARNYLVRPAEVADFDFLAHDPVWHGVRLKTLLDNVQLAHYNRTLVNWRLDDAIYRDFVLSPSIAPGFDEPMDWRRDLWESFYLRIRREQTPEDAARVVARHLRESVTLVQEPGKAARTADYATPVRDIRMLWRAQIADEPEFEALYVAALRSVGIPARLGATDLAKIYSVSKWIPAPRPLVSSFLSTPLP
jgi:hypothetical protein